MSANEACTITKPTTMSCGARRSRAINRWSMPAPSGPRTLRVSAEGYETAEQAVELPADPGEADVAVSLRPK